MVERLGPEDLVAVLSFDTHLKLWCRLEEALVGHDVLEVAHPGGPRGRHTLDVDLVGPPGWVLARRAYFD